MKTIMNITQLGKNDLTPASNMIVANNLAINGKPVDNYDVNIDLKSDGKQFTSKVCYDNPTFIGVTVNHINQNNVPNITSMNIPNESPDRHPNPLTPQPERYRKERTFSRFSVASISSFKNALGSDRRYSRRQSMVQRKYDIPDSPDDSPDLGPLRRRMSFIKDTSGDEEPLSTASIQILIASLCAGLGNVGAGVIIDIIQTWRVFVEVKTMFVLIPSLLGLKGILEMTMASRLSTEANMGHMDSWPRTLRMIGGDMSLVQCQATVVSFLASFVAIGIDLAQTWSFEWNKMIVLIDSSVLTANIACFLLENLNDPNAVTLAGLTPTPIYNSTVPTVSSNFTF